LRFQEKQRFGNRVALRGRTVQSSDAILAEI